VSKLGRKRNQFLLFSLHIRAKRPGCRWNSASAASLIPIKNQESNSARPHHFCHSSEFPNRTRASMRRAAIFEILEKEKVVALLCFGFKTDLGRMQRENLWQQPTHSIHQPRLEFYLIY